MSNLEISAVIQKPRPKWRRRKSQNYFKCTPEPLCLKHDPITSKDSQCLQNSFACIIKLPMFKMWSNNLDGNLMSSE